MTKVPMRTDGSTTINYSKIPVVYMVAGAPASSIEEPAPGYRGSAREMSQRPMDPHTGSKVNHD